MWVESHTLTEEQLDRLRRAAGNGSERSDCRTALCRICSDTEMVHNGDGSPRRCPFCTSARPERRAEIIRAAGLTLDPK